MRAITGKTAARSKAFQQLAMFSGVDRSFPWPLTGIVLSCSEILLGLDVFLPFLFCKVEGKSQEDEQV